MGNDQLSLAQKLVGHAYAFVEQAAGILPQIEDQPFQIAHLVKRVGNFMFRGLIESGDVHVTDAGLYQEVQVNAIARNFIANHRELQRFVRAFAQNRDVDCGSFGSFQQVGDVASAHVVGGLAIDRGDDVARTDAGAICGRSDEGRNHNNFIVARADRHADAVIFAALIFTQQRISFWIEKVRVRIEHVQHARNSAVVDGLVRIHRLGVVLFDNVIDSGELTKAVTHIGVTTRGGRRINLLSEDNAQKSAGDQYEYNQKECATRTTNHLVFLRWGEYP